MGKKIDQDRERSHILKKKEYRLLHYFCERLPQWVTPNLLTAFGLSGSLIIFLGLWAGTYYRVFLLLSIVGLAVHWFGDSLDGRLAYYRNIPRKWFGFSLDINVDWASTCIIASGLYIYLPDYKFVAALFLMVYGSSMIIALLRYRITDQYIIDTFGFGPTEVRLLLALVLFIEMFRTDTLLQFGLLGSLLLFIFNLIEITKLQKSADEKDQKEKETAPVE